MCDACQLKLFLAKKSDGTWLHASAVGALTLDKNGCLKGFKLMDLLLRINNSSYLEENFQPDKGEIHILVIWQEKRDMWCSRFKLVTL